MGLHPLNKNNRLNVKEFLNMKLNLIMYIYDTKYATEILRRWGFIYWEWGKVGWYMVLVGILIPFKSCTFYEPLGGRVSLKKNRLHIPYSASDPYSH